VLDVLGRLFLLHFLLVFVQRFVELVVFDVSDLLCRIDRKRLELL
jgi:hypothetical protein